MRGRLEAGGPPLADPIDRAVTTVVDMFLQLVDLAGVHLPKWAYPVGIAVLALALLPFRVKGERANTARRILLKASGAGSVAERDRLEAQAIAEVRDEPHGLLTIAAWAVEHGRYPLARHVLDTPSLKGHKERRRLLATMAGAAPLDADAITRAVLGDEADGAAGADTGDDQRPTQPTG